MNLQYKKNYFHLFFITFLFLHYLFPLILVGQVIIEPHDILDGTVVNDHIISKIYKGDFESLNYFLSGEIKWYNLEKLFYPTNVLHYFLDDKLFYFTNDVLKKLSAYFTFYLLAKSLSVSRFKSCLGGLLYSTLIFHKTQLGLALPFAPYVLYLLLNKDTLNKKHYTFLFLIGLNSSLIHDIFVYILLIPLSFLLNKNNIKKNLIIYLQIFSVIFISSILSNIHLVVGTILSDPIHRDSFVSVNNIILPFLESFKNFITYINPKEILFIFYIPLAALTILTIVLSLLVGQKNIKLIFLFILIILILKSLFDHSIIDNILIGKFSVLQGYNFQRIDKILPLVFTLLFILIVSNLANKNFEKFILLFSFVSIFSIQAAVLSIVGQSFLKQNMHIEKFQKTKKTFSEKKYVQFFRKVTDKKNYSVSKLDFNISTNKTFDGFYKFKDYSFIKNIVQNSRVMSVGLDPMVAVMNDIKVIDGYHNIYPLSYKKKFRKIIEKELENNIILRNYYDNWGNRIYAFYTNKNNIMLNFKYAKELGADYVISKFPIKNNELKMICRKCNNSKYLFLYKIL